MLSFCREGAKTKTLGKSFETLIDSAKDCFVQNYP